MATACSNESVPWGIFQMRSDGALAYSAKPPRPLALSRENGWGGQQSPTIPVDARISRMLTPSDSRADFLSNLDIDFEVWSELYDLSCEVAPGVSAFDGEVLVG